MKLEGQHEPPALSSAPSRTAPRAVCLSPSFLHRLRFRFSRGGRRAPGRALGLEEEFHHFSCLFNHWNLLPAFRLSTFLHGELLHSMSGFWTQKREQRWAGLGGGSGMQEADVLDVSGLGEQLLLIRGVNCFVNLDPTVVCSLTVPWGGHVHSPCPLARPPEGPAGGFLVILFFNIQLIKVLKVQEARWEPENIVLLVSS